MHQLIADTLDDLLLKVFPKILRDGERVKATKGWNKELSGVVLELRNPLARLSRTETKGTVFSRLGDTSRGAALDAKLIEFDADVEALLGIKSGTARAVLVDRV